MLTKEDIIKIVLVLGDHTPTPEIIAAFIGEVELIPHNGAFWEAVVKYKDYGLEVLRFYDNGQYTHRIYSNLHCLGLPLSHPDTIVRSGGGEVGYLGQLVAARFSPTSILHLFAEVLKFRYTNRSDNRPKLFPLPVIRYNSPRRNIKLT